MPATTDAGASNTEEVQPRAEPECSNPTLLSAGTGKQPVCTDTETGDKPDDPLVEEVEGPVFDHDAMSRVEKGMYFLLVLMMRLRSYTSLY